MYLLYVWLPRPELSIDKFCNYLHLLLHDIKNVTCPKNEKKGSSTSYVLAISQETNASPLGKPLTHFYTAILKYHFLCQVLFA